MVSINAVVENGSEQQARTEWVPIAVRPEQVVPSGAAAGAVPPGFWRDKKNGFVGVLGSRLNRHGYLIHVQCRDVAPGDILDLQLEPDETARFGFSVSEWAADDLAACVPWPTVFARGARHDVAQPVLTYVPEYSCEAVHAWSITGRVGTTQLLWQCYAYVFHQQDAIAFDWRLTCGRPSDPAPLEDVDAVFMRCGEFFSISNAAREGAGPLVRPGDGSWWATLVEGPIPIGTWTNLAYLGWVHTMPTGTWDSTESLATAAVNEPDGSTNPEDVAYWNRVENHRAILEGPMHGVLEAEAWDGGWLGLRRTPPRGPGDGAVVGYSFGPFRDYAREPGSYWAPRPLAGSPDVGRGGDQACFGVTKGAPALWGEPLHVEELLHSAMASFRRPTSFREDDGSLLLASAHPDLKTWSQLPDGRNGSDMLGKEDAWAGRMAEPESHGWQGEDDQHYAPLPEDAAYALTGRLILRDRARERMQAWLAGNHDSSARARGRCLQWLVDAWLCHEDLEADALGQIEKILAEMADVVGLSGPIRPLAIEHDDLKPPLLDAQGNVCAAVVIWKHALACIGLGAVLRSMDSMPVHDLRKTARDLLVAAGTVVLLGGTFQVDGEWRFADAVAWLDGRPLTPAEFGSSGNVPGRCYSSGYFWHWNISSVRLLLDVLEETGIDPNNLAVRCREILAQDWWDTQRNGVNAAEWRARAAVAAQVP